MEYVNKLLKETDFLEQIKILEQLEQNREFCRHGLNHLLDTARIAWIAYLEQFCNSDKERERTQCGDFDKEREMIYLAALLHDLGRIKEYQEGISHHVAGAVMAEDYLLKIGYPKEQSAWIVPAIQGHRRTGLATEGNASGNANRKADLEQAVKLKEGLSLGNMLGELLRYADKKSRNCFFCEATEACNWEQDRRNYTIAV